VEKLINLWLKCGGTAFREPRNSTEYAQIRISDLAFFVSQIPIEVAGDGHILNESLLSIADVNITDADYPTPALSQEEKMRALIAENEQLKRSNGELVQQLTARTPESIGYIQVDTEHGYIFIAGEGVDDLMDGRHAVYLQQIPARQSPSVSDYEEVLASHRELVRELDVLLNGDSAAKQASLCDVVGQVAQIVRETGKPLLQQSPAVAVPDWINCAERLPKKEDADIAGNITCRWHNGEIVAIPWADVEVGDDEWLCARNSTSPRITEQDAREIINSAFEYEANLGRFKFDKWLPRLGRALLNKLNEAKNAQ